MIEVDSSSILPLLQPTSNPMNFTRKMSHILIHTSFKPTTFSQTDIQQSHIVINLEARSVTDWGKTTSAAAHRYLTSPAFPQRVNHSFNVKKLMQWRWKEKRKGKTARECRAAFIIQVLILLPASLIKWIQPEREQSEDPYPRSKRRLRACKSSKLLDAAAAIAPT